MYGDDGIFPICGEKGKYCTPRKLMDHLGTYVPERPFDIYAKITNESEYDLDNVVTRVNDQNESKHYRIKPVNPKYHLCNETYQYGDMDYGAKCSCKVSEKT